MWSEWTGPLALAHFAHTGWDTCPASLAKLALFPLLARKDLLNATKKVKFLMEISHLTQSGSHAQSTLVGPSRGG